MWILKAILYRLYNIRIGAEGDSDVGDFMMVTDLRCWLPIRYVGDFFSVLNRSPTS